MPPFLLHYLQRTTNPTLTMKQNKNTFRNCGQVRNAGDIATTDGRVKTDIDSLINKASQAFNKLRNPLWNRREISIRTKMRIFNAVIMSILLYGGETWTILKNDSSRLETFQLRCLRCILQITRRDHQRNTDIRDRCCQQPMVEGLLRQRRLRWFGHVRHQKHQEYIC